MYHRKVICMIELISFILGFIIYVIIGTIILYAGATFTGVDEVSVKKAAIVSVLTTIVFLAFSWLPLFGLIIIFLAVMILVRLVFLTTWTKGFIIAIIYVIINVLINQFLVLLLV